MSTKAVAWALEQTVSSPAAKLVLVGVAEHADRDTWIAWPSRATCALYAGCSPRTVTRHFATLIQDGFLVEVTVDDLTGDAADRFAAMPADRRPRLWQLQPGRQPVHPRVDTPDQPRVDKLSPTGGQTGGHSSVHRTKQEPSTRTAGRVVDLATRRDYADATATAELLDQARTRRSTTNRAAAASALANARNRS